MSKINKAMEKILKNLDGKVMEVGSSIHEVFIVMKMLETQVGQLVGQPMGNKEEFPRHPKVPRRRRLLKLIRER
jgi:archaellum component FlaC